MACGDEDDDDSLILRPDFTQLNLRELPPYQIDVQVANDDCFVWWRPDE